MAIRRACRQRAPHAEIPSRFSRVAV